MEFQFSEEAGCELRDIPPFLFQLLEEIIPAAESTHPRVEGRFFPSPTSDPEETSVTEDWAAFVQPGLLSAFQEARETVRADLRRAEKSGKAWRLFIPAAHTDAWLSALNQARLSLTEQHGFGEAELGAEPPADVSSDAERSLLQIHFYGVLQEWLVRTLA